MSTRTEAAKRKLLDELRKTPIVQIATQRTGVPRTNYYRWLRQDKKFAQAAAEAIDRGVTYVNEMAEAQLISAIREGNLSAIIWWTRNRHPAFRARLEVDAKVKHESGVLTPEQEAVVAKALTMAGIDLPKNIKDLTEEKDNELTASK